MSDLLRRIVSHRSSLIAIGVMWSLLALSIGTASAADGANSKTRWAIIAVDPQLGGLTDLLTAELSTSDDVELVERDQLDRVVRELDLAAHFGADDAAHRLQLGQILKADRLVLLSVQENGQQPFLRLVVSDCSRLENLLKSLDALLRTAPTGVLITPVSRGNPLSSGLPCRLATLASLLAREV